MPLGKAKVIPKNQEKCNFILNCMKLNESDPRPPQKFVLPQIEELRNCLLMRRRKRPFLIKLDVSNCYWSINMFQLLLGERYRLGGSTLR